MTSLRIHLYYLAGIILFLVMFILGFSRWIDNHDARIKTEVPIKESEQAILKLEDQIDALAKLVKTQKATIVTRVETVKTPAQAVAAIPSLSLNDLNPRALPAIPDAVAVNAVALTKELGSCAEDRLDLSACRKTIELKDAQSAAKDAEIVSLKKKPSFWKRFSSGAKKIGIGVAIGIGLAGAASI